MNAPSQATEGVDWARVRGDFPLLQREVHGKPLLYFDNANTSQKPLPVIAAQDDFYRRRNANVSRAVHALGTEATDAYEAARARLAHFLGARADELVLCSGTTFALNLVAYSWALPRLEAGDIILISRMEHHANIVPWQLVAERTGARIRVAEILADGSLDLDALYRAMTPEVKLLAVTHVSNVLGTVNPVREICREARRRGIVTVVDGSQAAPHLKLDLATIGCDFYAVTGHKMCGPTGTGALWARREHLAAAEERRHLRQQFAPRPQRAGAGGAAHLVAGQRVEIAAERRHVHRPVRHGLRAVDDGDDAAPPRFAADLAHRVDRAQHVADVGEAEQLHLAGHRRVQRVEVERSVGQEFGDADRRAGAFGDELPRHDVGVVLHPREQDDVAGLQSRQRPRIRDEIERKSSTAAQHQLVAMDLEETGELRPRAFVGLGGLGAQRVDRAADVGVVAAEEVVDGVDHRRRLLPGVGRIEVDQRLAVDLSLQQREVGADRGPVG